MVKVLSQQWSFRPKNIVWLPVGKYQSVFHITIPGFLRNFSMETFTTPVTRSCRCTEWSLTCLSIPMFVYLTLEHMNVLWLFIFNKSVWYRQKKVLGQSDWSKAFIVIKNIAMRSWTGPAIRVGEDELDDNADRKTETINPIVNIFVLIWLLPFYFCL